MQNLEGLGLRINGENSVTNKFDINFFNSDQYNNLTLGVNKNYGKDLTIFTVGDSWTWGDELGEASGYYGIDDKDAREASCFGNLLSQQLNANWVQLALPGGSNAWIMLQIKMILPQLARLCKQVIVVIGYTELGREFNQLDFDWKFEPGHSITDSLTLLEKTCCDQLDQWSEKYKNVKFVAGPIFTDSFIKTKYQPDHNWLELLTTKKFDPTYMTPTAICYLNKFLIDNDLFTIERKQEFVDVYAPMFYHQIEEMKINKFFVTTNNLLLNFSNHPNKDGHVIWANYLEKYICENIL